jgi:cytochrome o ubiquinol oxidase subunit 3
MNFKHMTTHHNNSLIALTAEAYEEDSIKVFGFWVYLMTDLILFASLFAVYAVLRANTVGGPSGYDLFNGPFVLAETIILLTSSLTCGFTILAARAGNVRRVVMALIATFALGTAFFTLELSEFSKLVADGNSWQRSGFLSSYFTLVGTHGLHIFVGLLWALALVVALLRNGLTRSTLRKLALWSMFWHFLEIVWIFIFTFVYLFSLS